MDQIIINPIQPLVITGNLEAVKLQMLEGIKKYEIEVTEDNLKDAKKMATELNGLSKVINDVKIEKVKEMSGPIEQFKVQIAELIKICQDGREKILAQVKVFEAKTLAKCKELIEAEFAEQLNAMGIRPEFRTESAADMVGLSALTESGALKKGTKDGIKSKVSEIKMLQDKVDMRLLQLENASLKAGLRSPLRREHVEAFLMVPDDQYEIQLSRIIGIESARQTETENQIKKENSQKTMRYFKCCMCGHIVSDYDLPAQCPSCPSKGFNEFPGLLEAKNALVVKKENHLPPPPMPVATPPAPMPSITGFGKPMPAVPGWNQERLHQMRQHLGDEVFFQMFKIVYQPISDRAIQDVLSHHPDLVQAIEWAKGEK